MRTDTAQRRVAATTARQAAEPRGRSPLLVGYGVFVLGLVVLAAGLGVAIYHLVKVGVSPVSAAGLVAIGGGLFLVAAGGRRVWRGTPRWWRLAVVPTLLLLAVLVVAPLGQAVAATFVPPMPLGTATPGKHGLAARTVTFPATDGVSLSGWYVPSANGAAVVLLHGSGSTRTEVLEHAEVLARHGYGVLLYDARGHGTSDGRAMELGWYGDEDVAGAVGFLQAQPDVDRARIAAVGMSMGGEQAIGAAAADSRIRAVVAEGATGRVAGDDAWLPTVYGVRGTLTAPVAWLTTAVTDLVTAADAPITLRTAATAMAPRPVLLITAGEVAEETHAAAWIREGAPGSVDVWTVEGAAHTGALQHRPAQWEERVAGFLDAALSQHGAE